MQNLTFAELHAASELSQDPAAYLARNGLRDVVGECLKWANAADMRVVMSSLSGTNAAAGNALRAVLGECFDALNLWEEQLDGINFGAVEFKIEGRLFQAGFRPYNAPNQVARATKAERPLVGAL